MLCSIFEIFIFPIGVAITYISLIYINWMFIIYGVFIIPCEWLSATYSALPHRKNYMRSILQVYFDYASFTLQILEVKLKYALLELPKKKYKWSIKTEKRYFVYFSDIWYLYFLTFVEMNYTSSILLSLKINILI